ncbi:MAG: PSD1 and planctomycete cytochrome C domain-containing protein [Bryobacteraceae bacterium]
MQCHGREPLMAQLDLRTREGALKGAQHGPVVIPGNAAGSHLYRHLKGLELPQMPLGGRLSDSEIAVIKNWIDSGAEWDSGVTLGPGAGPAGSTEKKFTDQQRRYWAFQKVVKPAVPQVKDRDWDRNPIDAFIMAELQDKNLRPNPPADKITLLRRATLDLIGLPPTPEEVRAFLADTSPGAFAKVVDRLLASPQYGERWGRHWLDLARYADTNGFKGDETRPNIWRYRDYVIQAFNQDKPYDRFIREQIAGDELYPNDMNARIAVGFNRHFTDETNQPVIELRRQETLNDITDTTGAVFLGMTYGCARCHDHKFDPILQKDYYRLQAFFANIREQDDLVLLSGADLETYKRQQALWEEKTRDIRGEMDAMVAPLAKARRDYYSIRFSPGAKEALATPPERRTPLQSLLAIKALPQITYEDRALVNFKDEEFGTAELTPDQKKRFKELEAELRTFEPLKPNPPMAQTIVDNGREAPKSHILGAGNWDVPRDEVQPGFLSILDPGNPQIVPPEGLNSTGRRSVLANWLADARNPLVPRVMVNRIWHFHFGRGIVASTSDFGVMGDRPANPRLLDYLASVFVENGWSIKKMHRLIMLSKVYRESSGFQAQAAAVDPDNKLLWRYDRHRLEAEAIRDSMLFVSGVLNSKMGGPGVHAPLPAGVAGGPVAESGGKAASSAAAKGASPDADRRSVYIFVQRNMVYPMLDAFDAPNPQETCSRRFRSVIPSQALIMMNDTLVADWARALASRVLNDGGLSLDQQVDRAYRLTLSRPPAAAERKAVVDFLDRQSALFAERPARNEKLPPPGAPPAGIESAHAAAFVDFCHALINSNEFLYVN